jgi:glycosyltransferase involved in cell wall biosynthesis
MPSRCDLHVHSRRSDRPSEWYLERIGAAESFTDPADVVRIARARGMDFVTLTDHDTIDGALEIAHLPGTFVSCEVTAAFAEDGAQVHVLVWGISEADHREIQALRRDVRALVAWLVERDVPHALAHPLFRVDDRLSLAQLEQCLLLFRRFELVNGSRDARATELFRAVVGALDAPTIERLADRHGVEPVGPVPWRKRFVAGSDDHCGLYVANAWTETPTAGSVRDFLDHLRASEHEPAGETGSSLQLARAFQALAHDYYRTKVLAGSRWRNDPIADLLRRLASGEIDPREGDRGALAQTVRRLAAFLPSVGPVRPASALLRRAGRAAESALTREEERAVFEGSARLAQRATARALDAAVAAVEQGRPLAALPALSTLSTAVMTASPYVAAFRFQHKDEPFHRELASAWPALAPLAAKSDRRVWATDTLTDVNGVARTVAQGAALARRRDVPVTVLTSLAETPRADFDLECFAPVWRRPIPRYEELELRLPPFLEVVEWMERERFGEVLISTPGPVGLTALAGARLLGLPSAAIHHTDFPRYVGALGGGEKLAAFAGSYLRWFYAQVDRVFVSSESYRAELERLGVEPNRLRPLPRGVDAERFHPGRRRRDTFARGSLPAGTTFLYVGRLAPEKNLELLLDAFAGLAAVRDDVGLALVGDGPLRAALERRARGPVAFCGTLAGDPLAEAYASADVFVFPSRTDTFGNAVLEAMSSGLPVVASAEGGPAEQLRDGVDGWIVDGTSVEAWRAALARLAADPVGRRVAGRAARAAAELRGWEPFLDALFGPRAPAVAATRAI